MGQESSQEKAATGSANTPTDPTRTPSATEEADTANHMFGQIAEAMDASQNRRKSQLLQSPESIREAQEENEDDARSLESRKKTRKERHSDAHREKKQNSKKDKNRKSLDVDSSQLIPDVETFEREEQPSQTREEVSKVLEPASDEQPKSGSKKHKHKKSKENDKCQLRPEPEQEDENAIEEQAQPEVPVEVASASQHKSKSEKRKHKKSRDAESTDAAPEEESIVVAKEPAEVQQAILSPPSEEQSMQKTKKSKKKKRREKKARQSLLDQLGDGGGAAKPDEQSQVEDTVLEPAPPALMPAAERQEPAGEAVAAAEPMDVIPESSSHTPATPNVGSKKKLKTFKSAQKKKILSEQMDEHDADAIPPTQPSQAEETQVPNSYELKDAQMPDARRSQSPSGTPVLSEAEVEDKGHEVEAEEDEEPEVVVKPKKSKNSKEEKKEKKQKKQKKRRLPVDDVTDTPSKRARLDIQAPPEQEPTKAMLKKAKRKAKLAEEDLGDENHEGMFSDGEWQVIDSQLEKYRGMHDLTVEEQNRIIQGPVGRRDSPTSQLFTFVMEEMHYRKRWSVIHAMRRRYHDFDKRGAWAPEDDEELMAVYARYPAQWKEIGSRLNRHPDDCRDRYRYVLVCGTNIHWGRWSLDEEQLLQKVVEELLSKIHKARQEQTAELDEEERALFYEEAPSDMQLIDWDVVSAQMGRRRGPRQCIEKYKIIQKRTPARWAYYAKKEGKAVLQASKMTLEDKINLLEVLKEAAVDVEDDIDWKDVASKLIELDSEGNISKLTPKFCRKSAEKAWTKLRYLVENANSLEFKEILDTLLDKLNSSGDEDPSKGLFQARIGTLDVHVEARKDLKPAKRAKHNVIAAAAMTLEDKRHLLTKLQKSGAKKEDDIVWPQIFPNIRRGMHKFAAGWEANKLAWELLSTFLESTEGTPPAGLQDRVSLLIEMFEHHGGEDPTHELIMELIEKKSLQDALKKFKERKSSTAKNEAVETAAKNKIANMPASAKIMVLEALLKSGIKDEDDIMWSKHGYIPYMKKCTYNAHAQRMMLQELKATVDKVEEYEFQDLIEHLITELSGYSKEERQRKSRGPRQAHVIKPTAEKLEAEASRRKNNWSSSTLSKKVLDESDDEVDEDVVESLNDAANPQGEADGDSDAEVDKAGQEVTVVQTPTTQSSSPAPASVEKPASAEKSPSGSPAEELRKDLYEFDEDELEETMLKSAIKKRKTPKKLSLPASPETAEDNSIPEITLEVDSEPEQEKTSGDEMLDATPEVASEAEEEEEEEEEDEEAADQRMPAVSPEAEDSFVKSLELEADQRDRLGDEFEDSISQFAALRAQRRKDIQKLRSSVVPDSEDEAPATTEAVQRSQQPPPSPPLTFAEKKRRKKERKEKGAKRRSEIAETQEEETATATEPREIVRGQEDFISPYMNAKVQSSMESSSAAEAPVQEAPTATQVLDEEAAADDAAKEELAPPTSTVETMSEKRKEKKAKKEKRASLTTVNDKYTSSAAEARVEDAPTATQVLEEQAEAEEALGEEVPKPSSPVEKMFEKRKKKKAKKEKRHSEAEETQEDKGPSALDVLVALGSQKKPSPPNSQKKASPPKQAPEDVIPPTSSMLPTMSQVIKQSKKNKRKRHSDVGPIPEVSEPQEEEVEAPVVAEEAEAMVAVDAGAPASSMQAPFPDIPTATQEMPPPSSIFNAPFPDIPASEDEIPVPSSVPPPSSPPLSSKQRRKLRRAEARADVDAPPRPATPSPGEEPVSNLAKSLGKAKRGSKRAAATSVEELEAGETQEQEAPRTARKAPRVSVPLFTPRTSRRERRPTQKAMTPYK